MTTAAEDCLADRRTPSLILDMRFSLTSSAHPGVAPMRRALSFVTVMSDHDSPVYLRRVLMMPMMVPSSSCTAGASLRGGGARALWWYPAIARRRGPRKASSLVCPVAPQIFRNTRHSERLSLTTAMPSAASSHVVELLGEQRVKDIKDGKVSVNSSSETLSRVLGEDNVKRSPDGTLEVSADRNTLVQSLGAERLKELESASKNERGDATVKRMSDLYFNSINDKDTLAKRVRTAVRVGYATASPPSSPFPPCCGTPFNGRLGHQYAAIMPLHTLSCLRRA